MMNTIPRKTAAVDVTFIAPAVFCNLAVLCGLIPAVLCLNGTFFAYLSVVIFALSMVCHMVIIARWQRYHSASPIAYAIVQPVLHLVMMAFALAVGATNFCAVDKVKAGEVYIGHNESLFRAPIEAPNVSPPTEAD